MTEKQITSAEASKIVKEVFDDYIQLYQMDRIDFKDFVLIENILIKLQLKFEEVFEWLKNDLKLL